MARLQYQIPDDLFNKLLARVATVKRTIHTSLDQATEEQHDKAMIALLKGGKKALEDLNVEFRKNQESTKSITIGALVVGLLAKIDEYSDEELTTMMKATNIRIGRPPIP
jgi:hypothetical protein